MPMIGMVSAFEPARQDAAVGPHRVGGQEELGAVQAQVWVGSSIKSCLTSEATTALCEYPKTMKWSVFGLGAADPTPVCSCNRAESLPETAG